jgi:hypothetical protein
MFKSLFQDLTESGISQVNSKGVSILPTSTETLPIRPSLSYFIVFHGEFPPVTSPYKENKYPTQYGQGHAK